MTEGVINVNINYKDYVFEDIMDSKYAVYGSSVNGNFKNVISFLKEYGYLRGEHLYGCKGYITKKPLSIRDEEHREYYDDGAIYEMSLDEALEIGEEDLSHLAEDILSGEIIKNTSYGEKYVVYIIDDSAENLSSYSRCTNFSPNELPEYLKKYID